MAEKKVASGRRGGPGKRRQPRGVDKMELITVRVSAALKAKLEKDAARRDRTLSTECAERLAHSYGDDAMGRALGEGAVKALALMTAKITTDIEALTGQSWRADRYTHAAVVHALRVFMECMSPVGPVDLPPRIAAIFTGASAERGRAPEDIGSMIALGWYDKLRLMRPPPSGLPVATEFSESFHLAPLLAELFHTDGGSK